MDQALVNQAHNVPEEADACGVCGAAVRSGPPPEPRAVTTTVGPVGWEEPKRYCPQCRAAFSLSRVWELIQGSQPLRSPQSCPCRDSQNTSFAGGSENLQVLAGLKISKSKSNA